MNEFPTPRMNIGLHRPSHLAMLPCSQAPWLLFTTIGSDSVRARPSVDVIWRCTFVELHD